MNFKTEQEAFWVGDFGQEYMIRNNSEEILNLKLKTWSKILDAMDSVKSIKEFGCNIGLNLMAIKKLNPDIQLSGIEINEEAARKASALNIAEIETRTIIEKLNFELVDMTFTAGVLIHINPNYLTQVYDNLVSNSRRYILVSEYFNPVPTSVIYRGNKDKLFKRDFAGELIDQYNLKLVDYSFVYSRDRYAPGDNFTWFLLEK